MHRSHRCRRRRLQCLPRCRHHRSRRRRRCRRRCRRRGLIRVCYQAEALFFPPQLVKQDFLIRFCLYR